jgi:hypothetical protein
MSDSRLHKNLLHLLRRNSRADQNLLGRIQVQQLRVAHVLQLLRRLIRRFEETLREDVASSIAMVTGMVDALMV